MEDYESQYDEYRQTLLRSPGFTQKLSEKRKNTMYAEKDFIGSNGALTKIGLLSLICGGLLVFSWTVYMHLVIRVILTAVAVGCIFWAMHIGAAFKEISGRSNFRSFVYDRHIEDRVMSDKDTEARNLVRSFLSREISREEFQKQFENLSRYDRFAADLKNDYDFSKALTKITEE